MIERAIAAQRSAFRAMAPAVVERPGGVLAAIVPAVPARSVANSVIYDDGPSLLAVRDEIAGAYAAAGVHAWTVWVHPGDAATAAELCAAGHVHDAQPMAMTARLDELDLEARAELDLVADPAWTLLGELNDRAYGVGASGPLAPMFDGLSRHVGPLYVARWDGEPASGLCLHLHEGCAWVGFVATVPEARGRGLAGELMRLALREAASAGCDATALEATAMGEPVYARLGYRSHGRLGMYELRTA